MKQKNFLLFLFLIVFQISSFGNDKIKKNLTTETLPYHMHNAMTAGSGLQGVLTNFSTCQVGFSATFTAAGYSGSWSNGNFNYYVNDVLIGSGVGSITVDLTAYIPITSLKIVKTNYNNWNEVDIVANVTSNTASMPGTGPTVSDITYCQGTTATPLTATLTSTGTTLKWYTTANGDFYSGTPTPNTSTVGTTSYWVAQTDTGGCESIRKKIDVIVNGPSAAPTVSTVNYYQGQTASPLTATGSNLLWYTSATGGTGSATAPTPSTATVGTTSYWVSQAPNGCESPRAQLDVVVNQAETLPYHMHNAMTAGSGLQGVLTNFSTCQVGFSATFTAAGYSGSWSNGNFNYYVNDVLIGSGVGSITVDLSSYIPITSLKIVKTNYNNWNEVDIVANVTSLSSSMPSNGPTVADVNYCQGATASPLSATLTSTGSTLKWYTSANGDFYSGTPTPNTSTVGTTSYWVAQANSSGCESLRNKIDVIVTAYPVNPVATTTVNYNVGDVATPLTATGTNLLWYTAATGGTGSTTAPTPSTTTAGTTSYWVSQSNNGCESTRTEIQVIVTAVAASHLNFDGVNDYIEIPKTFTSDFTIEYWMQTTSTGTTGSQWFNGNSIVDNEVGGVATDFGTSLLGSKLAFGIGGPDTTILSTTDVNDGTWKHVAVTWKQSTGLMQLYINGVLEASATASTAARTASNFIKIGSSNVLFSYFSGNIDELRIWNKVLSQSDIQATKDCELQPSETGILAYYKFNQGNGNAINASITSLADAVGSNNGTLTNFALTGAISNWKSGSSITNGNVCTTLNTENIILDNTTFSIYPNPASNEVTVDLKLNFNGKLEIYDVNGRLLKSQTLTSDQNRINIEDLNSGVYFFNVSTNNTSTTKKIIKK